MFTKGDLNSETIDGEKYITFQPNTIVYAVPAKSDLAKHSTALLVKDIIKSIVFWILGLSNQYTGV